MNLALTHRLTPREIAVLTLLVAGSTNREAAGSLGISPRTIEFHRANIMHKMLARNMADLMRIVLEDSSRSSSVTNAGASSR